MTDNPKKRLSVFALAKRPGGLAVEIRPADVLELKPDWSEEQAKVFLGRHARDIATAMIAASAVAIRELIRSGAADGR